MPINFSPSQRPSMYFNTLPTENKQKKSTYSPDSENSAQELLDNWGPDAFKEKGPEGVLTDILYEAEKKFSNEQAKQEEFFEEAVVSLVKLYSLIHEDHNINPDEKDAFKEATAIVEAELTKRVYESPLPTSSRLVERTVEEKINTVKKTFHAPIGSPSIISDASKVKFKYKE